METSLALPFGGARSGSVVRAAYGGQKGGCLRASFIDCSFCSVRATEAKTCALSFGARAAG
jgi:hypothetical protein